MTTRRALKKTAGVGGALLIGVAVVFLLVERPEDYARILDVVILAMILLTYAISARPSSGKG